MKKDVFVTGSGTFLPGDPVAPEDIWQVLGDIPDAPAKVRRWAARSGPVLQELLSMERYHYAIDPATGCFTEDNVTMAVKASQAALDRARLEPSQVDFLAYGSPHMDQMPTPSVLIQEALGIEHCAEIAIHANCSSAYKALWVAHRMLEAGVYQTALVVSSNMASSELRADYYNQPLLTKEALFLRWFLCDGAGAVVLSTRPEDRTPFQLRHTYIESVGGCRDSRMFNGRPAYWMNPRQEFDEGRHHLLQVFQNQLSGPDFQEGGRSIFLAGLDRMILDSGLDTDQVRFFQVNLPSAHIAESVKEECAAYGIAPETFYTQLDTLGYCGPPMAFICLDKILTQEKLVKGDLVLSFALEVSKFMQGGYSLEVMESITP
jgi:3-oxoacyl-[acyl-carrier-protein] synthase III